MGLTRQHPLELCVPPPLEALVCALLMYGLAAWWPAAEPPWGLNRIIAGLLALLGVGIALAGVWSFRRASTTVHPLRPERSSALVTTGIYGDGRNPMYLGMTLVLMGWLAWLGAPGALLGPIAFVAWIQRFQILPEERVLEARFGADFADYRGRVRRWL